jgi:SAM-dependent methyltransferase
VSRFRPDHRVALRSLADWQSLVHRHPYLGGGATVESIVRFGMKNGVRLRLVGHVPPSQMACGGLNYREQFLAAGFNPRQRAMLETFIEHPIAGDIYQVRIWGHEALTPFALFLRGRFPKYVGSEYADTAAGRAALFPIPVIDVTAAAWPDESFDIILSGDVLEHVPDLDAALRECARVMRPGGRMVASFPFLVGSATTDVRAVIEDGAVRHLAPAEYHGNPVDPQGGSLVFQVPGWDIIDRCLKAGFTDASMQFWSSHEYGLVAADIAGILLLDARR